MKGWGYMKKVMLVDDAAFIRMTLRMMLVKNGFEIVGEASNGEEAVRLYPELKPDVVTMDVTMPEMDGLTALKAIMAVDPAAKILMVTAMGQEAMVRDCVVAGAKGFIVKPFKEDIVIGALNKLTQTA